MFTWCWQGFSHCHQTPLPVESVPLCSRPCRWSSQTGTQPDTGGPMGFWSLKIKTKCKFSVFQITVYYLNVNLPFTVQTLKFCTHRNFFLNSCRHQWLPLHSQTSTVVRVESVDLASPQFDQLIKTSITVQGMQFYENFFFLNFKSYSNNLASIKMSYPIHKIWSRHAHAASPKWPGNFCEHHQSTSPLDSKPW